MNAFSGFEFHLWDYAALILYFLGFSVVGIIAGRRHKENSAEYFLAGRTLPWYVVGGSFIASNISSEHFIGMVGAALIYGVCVSWAEWGNLLCFSLMIWFFIPFLIASGVFTTPEYLERRFHPFLRQSFAVVSIITNVVAFMAAVLYGGGLALNALFGWNLWVAILVLGIVAGLWTIYGGLSSVAWSDFFALIIMLVGGALVTILGLYALSPDHHSFVEGWRTMIERNQATTGIWAEFVQRNAQALAHSDHYNRLSLIQPASHAVTPWPSLLLDTFSVGIWYHVINQFMIQRVFGAKNMYHARMGIVLAGFMKIIMPALVILPGMILFALPQSKELLSQPLEALQSGGADKGYMAMLQLVLPVGIRGLFLAALIGAIQSTINAVLNSTATMMTLDIYQRHINKSASDRKLVTVGRVCTVIVLAIAILLAGFIQSTKRPLFVYIQELYAFFAPPFSAVFLLGILYRRINAAGSIAAVVVGFPLGIFIKIYVNSAANHPLWLEPFANQAILNWVVCTMVCLVVSLLTAAPKPEQVGDTLAVNWRKLNIFGELGTAWYNHVVLWWGLFVIILLGVMLLFSGIWS